MCLIKSVTEKKKERVEVLLCLCSLWSSHVELGSEAELSQTPYLHVGRV